MADNSVKIVFKQKIFEHEYELKEEDGKIKCSLVTRVDGKIRVTSDYDFEVSVSDDLAGSFKIVNGKFADILSRALETVMKRRALQE